MATLPYKLDQLLADRPRLARLKDNARRLGRPQAAFDVAQIALDWIARRDTAAADGVPKPTGVKAYCPGTKDPQPLGGAVRRIGNPSYDTRDLLSCRGNNVGGRRGDARQRNRFGAMKCPASAGTPFRRRRAVGGVRNRRDRNAIARTWARVACRSSRSDAMMVAVGFNPRTRKPQLPFVA